MSNAQAGPSSWQHIVRLRLEERDARERAHDDMIENYQRLARLAKQHRERSRRVLAAAGVTKAAGSTEGLDDVAAGKAKAVSGLPSIEAESVRQAYIQSLETELSAARNELATQSKTHASSASRIRTLDEQMRERDDRMRDWEEDLRKMRDEMARMRRRDDDLKNNIEAKDKAIELLQDEMATLTLELGQAEARMEELKRDNASLLQRWLDRMNTEAERMNEGNQFLEDVDRRRAAASTDEDYAVPKTPPRSKAREVTTPSSKGKRT